MKLLDKFLPTTRLTVYRSSRFKVGNKMALSGGDDYVIIEIANDSEILFRPSFWTWVKGLFR